MMIERRPFGRTGHLSTATIFGAAALFNATQAQADPALDLLLEHGINHIDVAASYGVAEDRLGPWMRRHRADFEALERVRLERNVAMQTIKTIALGPWAVSERTHTTWYQPLQAQADIDRAVHWAMARAHIFLDTVGDLGLLPKVLDAASRYEGPPPDAEMEVLQRERKMSSLFGIP